MWNCYFYVFYDWNQSKKTTKASNPIISEQIEQKNVIAANKCKLRVVFSHAVRKWSYQRLQVILNVSFYNQMIFNISMKMIKIFSMLY